jgi:hypothetical protein
MSVRRLLAPLVAVLFPLALAPPALATTATEVRVTETSAWNRPSPDPTGVVYQRSTGRLIVVDSEVEETGLYDGANAWFTSLKGRVKATFNTLDFTNEPTDVAVKGRRTFFFTDDDPDRVYRVRRGPDRRWGTADDLVSWFGTRPFGNHDPEGLALVHLRSGNALFMTSGQGNRVYRLSPGPNGRFDGVAPLGDDVVTSFSSTDIGVKNPKGIAVDAANRRLYLVGYSRRAIVLTTLKGKLVDTIDISASDIQHPSGITLAPGSVDAGTTDVYVTDKGVDNNPHPAENDGQLFEFSLS